MSTQQEKKLHIVHTESSLGWGGQEIRILNEAAGMLRRGHAVTLVCPAHAHLYAEAQRRGIPTVALPIGRKNPRGVWALRSWLRRHRPDVINSHSSTDSWLAALACRLLHRPPPLVRTRHISAPIPDNAATRWLYQKATWHIVTTGEKLRHQLIINNGYAAEHITSVPTGIDTEHFTPGDRVAARVQLGLPQDAPVVGIVATLRSWKGHQYLLEAFSRLALPDARLLIVGDGPRRTAIEQEIARLGLGERVILPGNQTDVLPWLQAMDVFVLPSYANEGVPQAILQAMLCALPVITTHVGSIAEAIQHEQTGLIVPPRNPEALAAAIERLLCDAVLRDQLGFAARALALKRFGLEAMLERMEAIFREAMAHG